MAAGVKTSGEFIFQNKNVARYTMIFSPVFFKSKKLQSKINTEESHNGVFKFSVSRNLQAYR